MKSARRSVTVWKQISSLWVGRLSKQRSLKRVNSIHRRCLWRHECWISYKYAPCYNCFPLPSKPMSLEGHCGAVMDHITEGRHRTSGSGRAACWMCDKLSQNTHDQLGTLLCLHTQCVCVVCVSECVCACVRSQTFWLLPQTHEKRSHKSHSQCSIWKSLVRFHKTSRVFRVKFSRFTLKKKRNSTEKKQCH